MAAREDTVQLYHWNVAQLRDVLHLALHDLDNNRSFVFAIEPTADGLELLDLQNWKRIRLHALTYSEAPSRFAYLTGEWQAWSVGSRNHVGYGTRLCLYPDGKYLTSSELDKPGEPKVGRWTIAANGRYLILHRHIDNNSSDSTCSKLEVFYIRYSDDHSLLLKPLLIDGALQRWQEDVLGFVK